MLNPCAGFLRHKWRTTRLTATQIMFVNYQGLTMIIQSSPSAFGERKVRFHAGRPAGWKLQSPYRVTRLCHGRSKREAGSIWVYNYSNLGLLGYLDLAKWA
jgi:hypothetical protein